MNRQTLRTLWRVDQAIVEAYYARALQGDIQRTEDHLPCLLEILDVICGNDGEVYAHQLKNVLRVAEGGGPLNKRIVSQEVVEEMVGRIHACALDSNWSSHGAADFLFMSSSGQQLAQQVPRCLIYLHHRQRRRSWSHTHGHPHRTPLRISGTVAHLACRASAWPYGTVVLVFRLVL